MIAAFARAFEHARTKERGPENAKEGDRGDATAIGRVAGHGRDAAEQGDGQAGAPTAATATATAAPT